MTKIRVGLYPRVSTQEQALEGYSIGEQIERLEKYCDAMGWTVYRTYTDAGHSGANTDRPGLRAMIKDVEAGNLDKIVVYKLDRLSRSQKDTLYLIEDVFLKNNCDFVSMSENFDTSTSFGRAIIGILAVFAQLEREQIRERMSLGMEGRAKKGLWRGGGTDPIGYDYFPIEDMLKINEYEKMQLLELFELFLAGTPLARIETMFREKGYRHKHGEWDTKNMRRCLANKLYIGYVNWQGAHYRGIHDSIIDDETFDKAQRLLEDREKAYKEKGVRKRGHNSLLSGLIFCGKCGARFSWTDYTRGDKYYSYYACYSRAKRTKKMIKDPNCKCKIYKGHELEDIIFGEIKKLATDPRFIADIKNARSNELENKEKIEILNKEIASIDGQLSRLLGLYALNKFTIEQLTNQTDPLEEQKASLMKQIEDIQNEAADLSEDEAFRIVSNFTDILNDGDFFKTKLAIDTLIERIDIDDEDITIHWRFI